MLGHGFELIPIGGGRCLVQSVPGELSMDDTQILQLAEGTGGCVTADSCVQKFGWEHERAERVLERLVRMERAWVDEQGHDGVNYWFPSLFLEQYNQLCGSASGLGVSS